jgi:Holliday junction resolvase RusA-like endonuclease
MRYTFSCPLPPTLNDQIAEARNNRYRSASTKKKWTQLIADIVADAPKFDGKVWVEFEWYVKNTVRDPDNTISACKFIMDGLVLAKVIKDDNMKIIQSPQLHSFAKAKSDSVKVILSSKPLFEIVRL